MEEKLEKIRELQFALYVAKQMGDKNKIRYIEKKLREMGKK